LGNLGFLTIVKSNRRKANVFSKFFPSASHSFSGINLKQKNALCRALKSHSESIQYNLFQTIKTIEYTWLFYATNIFQIRWKFLEMSFNMFLAVFSKISKYKSCFFIELVWSTVAPVLTSHRRTHPLVGAECSEPYFFRFPSNDVIWNNWGFYVLIPINLMLEN
jgi:hypothetical protein